MGVRNAVDLVKFRLVCRCGATWKGVMPQAQADEIKTAWRLTHDGDECGPATPAQAAAARRKAEAEAFTE